MIVYGRLKTMRKIFKKIFSATLILAMSFPVTILAADTKTEAYMAYYDHIQKELGAGYLLPSQDEGIGALTYYFEKEGIIYAKLLDFDGDGVDELFTVKSVYAGDYWDDKDSYINYPASPIYDNKYFVYDYQNGALKCVAEENFISITNYIFFI